ncbi:hypothetical protein CLU83_0518 [Flavobacterium sp. 1]|nr:hypothetical protein CLU83_0518 [Flavobacterium sp. 1]
MTNYDENDLINNDYVNTTTKGDNPTQLFVTEKK